METGGIQNLSEFILPSSIQDPIIKSSLHQNMIYQESSDEEDEFLKEDDIYEEEEENLVPLLTRQSTSYSYDNESNTEMTAQLLKFSEQISTDIQRYFGQKNKEEDPDSCNIYEDFVAKMSGPHIDYEDIVMEAQTKGQDKNSLFNPLTPPLEFDQKLLKSISKEGDVTKLGPLSELFDFGLHKYKKQKISAKEERLQSLDKKYSHIVPMHSRKLPISFWKEPSPTPPCILNNNTPDFSDLLENWTSDPSH
ncbi:protein PERCC1 [Bombina bombina]|uniref:protein PERCC1 n=1 Tax=Bombina bombina TaxID=8345 RepID=UPI00235A7F1F|nr:protein PERCC1 [Bombina bombina]